MAALNHHPQANRLERRRVRIFAIVCSLLLVAAATPMRAQERTARVYGLVTDASGLVVPGVNVVLTNTATGVTREAVSNAEGIYNAPKLEPGPYLLSAELPGFKKFVRRGINLLPGDTVEANIRLEIGEITDIVSVTEQAPMVERATGAFRSSLEAKIVEMLPLGARDAKFVLRLVPGTVRDHRGDYAILGIDGGRAAYSLDGTDAQDPWGSKLQMAPPPDTLKEFTVETNFSAEYGRAAGGAVLMTTKSGTNSLHGSAYDYFQSENLNANSFYNNALGKKRGELKQHQLGFTMGGPVCLPGLYDGRNRSFFFVGLQWLKVPATPYLWARGGLTAAELSGDFSQSKIVPTVSATASSTPGSPFAGMQGKKVTNLSSLLSPTAVRWYKTFNLPIVQNSGDRFYETKTQGRSQPQLTIRGDHTVRKMHALSFTMYLRDDTPELRHVDYAPETTTSATRTRNQHFTLADVWTIRPNMINDLRIGYQRFREGTAVNDAIRKLDWSSLGIPYPRLNAYMTIDYVGQSTTGSSFNPSFFNLRGNVVSTIRRRDIFDLRETLTFTHGRHFLKGGVTLQRHNFINTRLGNAEYYVNGSFLGNWAAEFLIGWPSRADLMEPYHQPVRRHIAHFFVQDDWKISPRLSANLGVRYEPALWGYRTDGRMLIFLPGAQSRYTNFLSGVITTGDTGFVGKSGRNSDLNRSSSL